MNTTINFSEINWPSIFLVLVLSFALGAFWHSSILFGKAWKKENNYDDGKKINPAKIFGLTAVFHFIAILGLDLFIGPHGDLKTGLLKGLGVSIVWMSTSMGGTYLFANRSIKLILIDAGFYIFLFAVAGAILGAWQ